MTWTNRVVWQEGMFLRAQHFQQQDRWLEMLVRARTAALRPHPWGVVEMTIDRDLLSTGRFALSSAIGTFEDGTPFSIPAETDHPPPLDLPESTRNAIVYLAAPIRQAGAVEIAMNGSEGRYALREFEAYDTHSGATEPAQLQVGRLRLRFLLETDDREGYVCLPIARIVEVLSDSRVVLDERCERRGFTVGSLRGFDRLAFALLLVIFVRVEQQVQPRHHLFERRQLADRPGFAARALVALHAGFALRPHRAARAW